MNNLELEYEQKQKESIDYFNTYIKDLLLKHNIEIINTEDTSLNLSQSWIDHGAGIDALMRFKDNKQLVYSVSLRIQKTDVFWDTFTIRYSRANGTKTEYAKLNERIDSGAMFPTYHVQCYIVNDSVKIGIVKTKLLIEKINQGECYFRSITGNDAATFAVVKFTNIDCELIEQ